MDGQDGRHQRKAVDFIGHVGEAGGLSVQHLTQVLLKQLTLEELPEVVAHHADLLLRPLGDKAVAPQKIADALLSGGIALLLPEFHLLGVMIQYDHLADAVEIVDGIHPLLHGHGYLTIRDLNTDGHALKGHIHLQADRFTAPQVLIYRLHARPMVDAYRRQHVAAAEPMILYADGSQILRGQIAVIRAHVGGSKDHQISRLQPPVRVGVNAVVEQAEALLGLLIDVGHDALPVHGEHGMRGRIHYALQNIHCTSPLSGSSVAILHDCTTFCNAYKNKAPNGLCF